MVRNRGESRGGEDGEEEEEAIPQTGGGGATLNQGSGGWEGCEQLVEVEETELG